MSVIPISCLAASDRANLGNNIGAAHRRRSGSTLQRRRRRQIAAVNRSLASVGERIAELHGDGVSGALARQ